MLPWPGKVAYRVGTCLPMTLVALSSTGTSSHTGKPLLSRRLRYSRRSLSIFLWARPVLEFSLSYLIWSLAFLSFPALVLFLLLGLPWHISADSVRFFWVALGNVTSTKLNFTCGRGGGTTGSFGISFSTRTLASRTGWKSRSPWAMEWVLNGMWPWELMVCQRSGGHANMSHHLWTCL